MTKLNRLILTPTSSPSRSIITATQELSLFSCPPSLLPVTLIHSTLPALISSSTPLILRSRLGIDPVLSPTSYSILTFVSATAELFIRLPFETVLRRGQASVGLRQPHSSISPSTTTTTHSHQLHSSSATSQKKLETVVEVGPYKGIAGTIWNIMFEEGSRDRGPSATAQQEKDRIIPVSSNARARGGPAMPVHSAQAGTGAGGGEKRKKGQGMQGLWRGWRVGMWGLVGMWGANAFGAAGGGNGVSEF